MNAAGRGASSCTALTRRSHPDCRPAVTQLIPVRALEIQKGPIAGARCEPGGQRLTDRRRRRGKASTTSGPTSPQHAPRQGPMAATRSAARDPNAACIARTARRRGAGRGAAPAGVSRADGARDRIVQQHRRAVRDADADRHRRIVGHDDVRLGRTHGEDRGLPEPSRARHATWIPCTCLTSRRRSAVTPIDAATAAHSPASSLSMTSREENRWGAASRVQRSARPHGSCVHVNGAGRLEDRT